MNKIGFNPFSKNLVLGFSKTWKEAVTHWAKTVSIIAAVAACSIQPLMATHPQSLTEKKIVRAAFDLGSGDFKLCVVDASQGNLKILLQKVIAVNLGTDCNVNKGTLSETIQAKALEALKELQAEAKREGATNFCGVATAVFRNATNGQDLLKRLQETSQIPLRIITQEEEGKLGFLTGTAIFPQIPQEELLLLDIGSSSIQITANNETYGADIGTSRIPQIFAEKIRHQTYSPGMLFDSITDEEILKLSELIINQIPESNWQIQRILSGKAHLTFADYPSFLDTLEQATLKKDTLPIEDLLQGIQRLKDPSFPLKNVSEERRQFRAFSFTLIYSLMKKFGHEKIHLAINETGNASGVAFNEEFWR